jgi:hypothetical protein
MECVLAGIGIDPDEIDLYEGTQWAMSPGTSPNPGFDTLLRDPARMKGYNIIFINCTENVFEDLLADASVRTNVLDYVAAGGRLYVTDWSYDYIEQIESFSSVIDFEPGASGATPEPANAAAIGSGGEVIQARVLDEKLAEWLRAVEARTGDEVITPANTVLIEDFLIQWVEQFGVAQNEQSKVWIAGTIGGMNDRPLTVTYDYDQCGRWLYSSYHTAGRGLSGWDGVTPFPAYCTASGLTAQDRVLEYLILHVADCITVD